MKVRHQADRGQEKIELQMTPMIDIVFQLLVFFIMTFKIVAQEGDFNIKMPLAAPRESTLISDFPPMTLTLVAAENGSLASMSLNNQPFGTDYNRLHNHIISIVGSDPTGPASQDAEVILDFSDNLRYRYVIAAITAVSGYVDENGAIVKLVEKIKFKEPDEAGF